MEPKGIDHRDQLDYLRKIEGQIRGIQKMIEERRYCVDILTQLHSAVGAILSVEDKILKRHLGGCVASAFRSRTKKDIEKKIDEMIELITKFRR